jgi:hypothetical protein
MLIPLKYRLSLAIKYSKYWRSVEGLDEIGKTCHSIKGLRKGYMKL